MTTPETGRTDLEKRVDEAARHIRSIIPYRPKIGIILGSGMGGFGGTLLSATEVQNDSIPHYPRSTVQGHSGAIICGKLKGISLLVFRGRVHFYESGDLASILFPVRVAHRLGIKVLLLTNAAGGVNRVLQPADLMLITDQINLTFENPLRQVPDPSRGEELYDRELQVLIRRVASERGIALRHGVYCGIKGPSYETAAEVEMIRRLGGDAIGMSTVNEASLAHALGMRISGISCITNHATGIGEEKLSHAEVTEVAARVKEPLEALLTGFVDSIGRAGVI
jgi:purine-nucleoside phosphorylase